MRIREASRDSPALSPWATGSTSWRLVAGRPADKFSVHPMNCAACGGSGSEKLRHAQVGVSPHGDRA